MAEDDVRGEGEEPADHRSRRRVHVLFPATIDADGQRWDVRLRNLSCTGALVETDAPLAPEAALVFTRAGATRPGKVVWTRSGRMGLTFDQPFTDQEVAALTRRERPVTPTWRA